MSDMGKREFVSDIREQRPVVHCITNIVTVNDCANVLLAVGASPTMAHAKEEVAEVTTGARALVLNLGATECFAAMLEAGKTACEKTHPVVFDPVGVAASSYRRGLAYRLLETVHPSCIRGNYSEIMALLEDTNTAAGVDECTDEHAAISEHMDRVVCEVAARYGCVVVASGAADIVSDGVKVKRIEGGSAMMRMITGAGCMSSCLLGAYLAVGRSDFEAAVACMEMIGEAAEAAEQKQKAMAGGSMTFHDAFIDKISLL